jgi:hypothetical protein
MLSRKEGFGEKDKKSFNMVVKEENQTNRVEIIEEDMAEI